MSDKTHGCTGTRGGDTKDGKTGKDGMDRTGKRRPVLAVEEEARNGIRLPYDQYGLRANIVEEYEFSSGSVHVRARLYGPRVSTVTNTSYAPSVLDRDHRHAGTLDF